MEAGTDRGSQPHHALQDGGLEDALADGRTVGGEPVVDEPHASNVAVLLQLLVVLLEELLRVLGAAAATLFAPTLQNAQAHARGRHRCGVWRSAGGNKEATFTPADVSVARGDVSLICCL